MRPESRDHVHPNGVRRCEVTGEKLRPDQVIFFRGRWVGPKGKQLLLERLFSGENPDLALVTAGLLRRLKAFLLDWAAFTVLIVLYLMAGLAALGSTFWICVFALVGYAIIVLYFGVQIGQFGGTTWGKRAAGVKIVRRDGEPITLMQGVMRGVYYAMPMLVFLLLGVSLFIAESFPSRFAVPQGVLPVALAVCALWLVLDILLMFLDVSQRRSFHDRLAGTRVIIMPTEMDDLANEPDDGDPEDDDEADYE